MTCLQRLVISRGLPKVRLQDALEAFKACTDLGLDIQLKVLQALPSLLQNYVDDLKGDLLSGALEVCSSLQSAKAQTVSGVAAATLQQLVTSIFEKVANEDRHAADVQALNEVHGEGGPINLRPAAFDAYRVFRDLGLAAEQRKTKFVQVASLSQESILELIWSCINSNPQLFASHAELRGIIKSNLLPLGKRALSEKMTFPITLRFMRMLDLVLGRYVRQYPEECESVLSLATHALDPDAAPQWKRAMTMEMLRNFFTQGGHVIEAYSAYDMNGKSVVQDLMSSFVRLSSERPAVIGLGQQSSVPVGPAAGKDPEGEQATVEAAGGMAGIISSALGVAEVNVAGVSSRFSLPRTVCLEQLDKSDAPAVPESYIYALVLECLSNLSDSLAKVVLPLTVQHEETKSRPQDGQAGANGHFSRSNSQPRPDRARSESFRKRAVPLNPLDLEGHASASKVRAVNGLVESCWPAVLATSSTFLNAALDDQYYRNLIKAYQRFAQVAGLLRLSTARDALMTTLGKAAVPPHVLNVASAETPKTPSVESPRSFSNPKSYLSVDSLVGQASTLATEKDRRGPSEPSRPMLTTRNLLCLRALLNLAIALGPTLDTAFAVVVDTLRQADVVLSTTSPQQMVRQGLTASQKASESPNIVQAFSSEVAAVEAAASRLLESTADYPNDAFINILKTFVGVLHRNSSSTNASSRPDQASPPPTPTLTRKFSGRLSGLGYFAEIQMQNYKFVIPKLGSLAELNVARFAASDPVESGWNALVDELVSLAANNNSPKEARRAATGVLCKVAAEIIAEVMEDETNTRATIQRRTLAVLLRLIDGIYAEDAELTSSDIEVQGHVVDALRAILERCGESLVAGWNRAIAIISSVFERSGTPPDRQDDEESHIDWEYVSKDLVSIHLGRTAFAATQLLCSDFLSALSTSVMPSLIELLYRFISQGEDLNISLSTITMAWNVSDFLVGAISADELTAVAQHAMETDDLEEEILATARDSVPTQWLLLLLRLQEITTTGHIEVRKASFQTVCNIFKNNGEQITPSTWDLTLRTIILRIAFSDVFLYHDDAEGEKAEEARPISHDENMSIAIISGTAEVIAQHLRIIEQINKLPSLWEAFLTRLEAYIDLEKHTLNAAVYQAFTRVLSRIRTSSKTWTLPMYRTLALWLKQNPATVEGGTGSNEATLVAYVDAGAELYRLTQEGMSTSQTRTFVENLYLAVRHSHGPRYGVDISSLSPVQGKAFELLKAVRSDAPSTLVIVAAKLITLHHDATGGASPRDGPTFIAISGEALEWVQTLVTTHIADKELLETGVIFSVVENLRRLIEDKYSFRIEHKGVPLWRKATITSLNLSKPLLEQCHKPWLDKSVKVSIWTEFVRIASGIVKASGLELVGDKDRIYEDELADIESFKALREVLVPRLGDPDLPKSVRLIYTRSLFEVSIVHAIERNEIPRSETSPLEIVGKIRRGRVRRVPYSRRERMCYECFSELINLASKSDNTPERKELAQVALPLLILRLAIPIRAYVADQPLRGSRPQPLSELEELLFSFESIKKLECEPDALSADLIALGRTGEKAHLHYLYPLLVKAVGTAGDRWSGADEVLTPLQGVLDAVSPGM